MSEKIYLDSAPIWSDTFKKIYFWAIAINTEWSCCAYSLLYRSSLIYMSCIKRRLLIVIIVDVDNNFAEFSINQKRFNWACKIHCIMYIHSFFSCVSTKWENKTRWNQKAATSLYDQQNIFQLWSGDKHKITKLSKYELSHITIE